MLEQCKHCPKRTGDREGPCIGQYMMNDAYCVKAKQGDARYITAILGWEPGGGPEVKVTEGTHGHAPSTDPDEAARLRRAAKPRIPLGTKPKGG